MQITNNRVSGITKSGFKERRNQCHKCKGNKKVKLPSTAKRCGDDFDVSGQVATIAEGTAVKRERRNIMVRHLWGESNASVNITYNSLSQLRNTVASGGISWPVFYGASKKMADLD